MERNHIENHDDSISISSSIFSMDFTLTKGRLDAINGGFTDKTEYISNGTREKLKLAETKLAAKQIATSSRTREKLALAEAELACKRNETSSKTRERLEEVEKQLALDHCCTSTRTREQLEFAEELLCRLNLMSENSAGSGNENEHQRKSKLFMKKQELLRRMLKVNANVDVAFLVDCTGSMDTYIQETKIDIQGIMTNIMDRFENRIRVAFVGYRDHGDGPLRIECLGFTENVEKFKRFVSNVPATGGNDAPEDVFGGLEAAINLTWSSRNKVIFHIADAPQHGFRFHNYSDSEDDYYGIEPRGLQVEDLLKSIKQMNIKYYFGKINDSTDKMINEFQRVGGAKVVEIIDMKNPDLLGMVVVESIATTIDYTLCKSMRRLKSIRDVGDNCLLTGTSGESGSRKTLKCFSISDVEPDYSCVKTEDEIKWLECNIPTLPTLKDIKNHIGVINHKWTTATVKIAADPFSQGEQRISYHGIKVLNPSSQNIVLKEFKHVGKGRDRREDYIEIMETQAVAAFMANEFNKVAPMGSKGIKFLHVSIIYLFIYYCCYVLACV